MKIRLIIQKNGVVLYEGLHEIFDAETCGRAFAGLWAQMEDRKLQKTTSVGELMEVLNEDVLEELNGAEIRIEKI